MKQTFSAARESEPTRVKQEPTHTHTDAHSHTHAHTDTTKLEYTLYMHYAPWHSCQSVQNIYTHTHTHEHTDR